MPRSTPEDRAREIAAKLLSVTGGGPLTPPDLEYLREQIADAVRAAVAENTEACARVAEDHRDNASDDPWGGGYEMACESIAAALRARPPTRPACAHDHPRGL